MTALRAGRGLALFVGAMLVVAACGSSAATTAPTQAPPTEPTATEAAIPTLGLPGFSFALPSFTSDKDLEGMFPDSVGGQPLTVQSMSGADFMSMGSSSQDVQTALSQLGKTPADLSVGFGGNTSVTIFAFRLKGVPADQFLGKYLSSTATGSTVTDASFGGKSVKQVATGGQVSVYIYLAGDVLWTVGSAGTGAPSDALLNEAFSKLP